MILVVGCLKTTCSFTLLLSKPSKTRPFQHLISRLWPERCKPLEVPKVPQECRKPRTKVARKTDIPHVLATLRKSSLSAAPNSHKLTKRKRVISMQYKGNQRLGRVQRRWCETECPALRSQDPGMTIPACTTRETARMALLTRLAGCEARPVYDSRTGGVRESVVLRVWPGG